MWNQGYPSTMWKAPGLKPGLTSCEEARNQKHTRSRFDWSRRRFPPKNYTHKITNRTQWPFTPNRFVHADRPSQATSNSVATSAGFYNLHGFLKTINISTASSYLSPKPRHQFVPNFKRSDLERHKILQKKKNTSPSEKKNSIKNLLN